MEGLLNDVRPGIGFTHFPPGYPHHLVGSRTLPDGSRIRIRPIAPADRHRHWRFVCSLSLQSRYHRLLSARNLLPGELRRMVEIDYRREMALVAVIGEGDDEQELGVARYVRDDPDPLSRLGSGPGAGPGAAAEFAIIVTDDWQRRGIGEMLLRSLLDAAADAGVSRLGGITLATNVRMIRLARRLGFEVSREPGDWTVRRVTWRQAPGDSAPLRAARSTVAQ